MNTRYVKFFLPALLLISLSGYAQDPLNHLSGDFLEHRSGLHAGNMFRTTIYNDGTIGHTLNDLEAIRGEWPINSGHQYNRGSTILIGSEVVDIQNEITHIVETPAYTTGTAGMGASQSPTGEFWTLLPLPGFANPDTNKLAMSKWRWSWPSSWPDKIDDTVDPGWPGSWNGYFGKDIFNADEESYYVMDDYKNAEYAFYPDSTDSLRRGLGMRVTARGFQWSNALVEDGMFVLYDIKNIGTYEHTKTVFGYRLGNNVGETTTQSGDGEDDFCRFDLELDIGYKNDGDNIGLGGWSPVGMLGCALLESPGNHYDGIDNDGDGAMGPGKTISEDMFAPRTLQSGENVVVIDYNTYERTIHKVGDGPIIVQFQDKTLEFHAGQQIEEIPSNLIDDNLDGLIDENNGTVVGDGEAVVTQYLYVGLKYIDYLTGEGSDNVLIDEKRDDNIDNDGDWDVLNDDVGLDGVPNTGDAGEGDGIPSSGRGTDLPGEPHIDKTDINESDMIGMTSFAQFEPWTLVPWGDDEINWQKLLPGKLDAQVVQGNSPLYFGSGFFPLKPGQTERISLGIICGIDLDDLVTNKKWFQEAYTENYNFSKAPLVPTVTAIPGDRKVTLMWDDLAEESLDPIGGKDFEGYRIYRSTDPGWNDMLQITDGQGTTTYRKPLAQFDLVNEHEGYAAVGIKGIRFYLGDNTGIVHSWTDTTVVNGQKYYYAVTSYDHGLPEARIAPTECSKYISIEKSGAVDKGTNVAIVKPEAPAAGYTAPSLENLTLLEGGTATGTIGYKIIDPTLIRDGHTYQVTFEDSIETIDSRLYPVTTSMTLADVTVPGSPDTLINKTPNIGPEDQLPMTDGFKLTLVNEPQLVVNENLTRWGRDDIYGYTIQPFKYSRTLGVPRAADYRIDFGEVGIDTSTFAAISRTRELDAMPVNFTITNTTSGKKIDFALWEKDEISGEEGKFTAFTDRTRTDIIIFMEPDENDSLTFTWEFELDSETNDSLHNNPQAGDFIDIIFRKPFLSGDVVEFTTLPERIEPARAKADMDRIKVVPNPYVVANSWEPLNPYANGRGPRELHFIHLPQKCTIKIFNIRGQLVDTIEHSNTVNDGTEIWDMQTKDLLDIAYGVYVYHVDAGELGQKIGKFAVIK